MVNAKEQSKQTVLLIKIERDWIVKNINILHQLSVKVVTDKNLLDEILIRCSKLETVYQGF